jgi:hypothetical protein
MLVIVAKMIVLISLVGPTHEAMIEGKPAPSAFLIASPETTGTSTSNLSAMISVDGYLLKINLQKVYPNDKERDGDGQSISSADRQSQSQARR